MFDKLIESEPEGADFHNRRRYFMVSSVVVGALFLTAVVISIYASDYGLGSNSFELSMMLAPVEMAAVEPEPARQPPAATSQSRDLPTRRENMPSVAENIDPPTSTSVVQNNQQTRPPVPFQLGPLDSTPGDSGSGNGRDQTGPGTGDVGIAKSPEPTENTVIPEPPPVKAPKTIVSGGVVNGKAKYLPVPTYPPPAKAVGAFGKGDVQVIIDESGKVVSATAVSGNPLLRKAAEQAARNAVFSPTYLTNVAVKVTGVIVYNFTR